MFTQQELQEILKYDKRSGVFTWLKCARHGFVGKVAGYKSFDYHYIRIASKLYLAHRLAWLYVHGVWPPQQIDHINGVKDDNRISNLRLCSNSQNGINKALQSNNKSGCVGVSKHTVTGKFRARSKVDGREIHLGYFHTKEEANYIVEQFRREQFQEFSPTKYDRYVLGLRSNYHEDYLDFLAQRKEDTTAGNIAAAIACGKAKYYGSVDQVKPSNKWRARCTIGNKKINLGRYDTKEEAQKVAQLFKKEQVNK